MVSKAEESKKSGASPSQQSKRQRAKLKTQQTSPIRSRNFQTDQNYEEEQSDYVQINSSRKLKSYVKSLNHKSRPSKTVTKSKRKKIFSMRVSQIGDASDHCSISSAMKDELAQDLEQLDSCFVQKSKNRQRASLSPKKEANNFWYPSNANEASEMAHSVNAKKKHNKRSKDKNRTTRLKKETNLKPKLCLPSENEHSDQNFVSQINKVVVQVKSLDGNYSEDLAKELGSFSQIKNQMQGCSQTDMSSSQCNPETVSSQANISRGKPPIQHQVKSMTLKEAFGTGSNSSQTTATKKTDGKTVNQSGFHMKPNLVISGQKSLIQAPSQSSLDKLKRGASGCALRPTNSSSSLTIVTPSSVNAHQKAVVKHKDKDSRANNTRNDMLLKRAQIHSQLLVHDSLQSPGLSKESGGVNMLSTIPYIVADLTLNNSIVIVKESARTTSKRSPMKARESIVSNTQMTSQKKHKRMHVRSNRQSMVVNSCADTKPPSHRLKQIPSIHSKSGINQGENSRAKVFSFISKTQQAAKESDHGFQSVRVKLVRDSVARKPSMSSQDGSNLNGLIQLRPMTVPSYQKRLSVPTQFNSQRQFNEDGQDLDAQTNPEQCMQTQPSQRSAYSNQISVQISAQRQNEALSSMNHSTVIIDTAKKDQSSNYNLQQKKDQKKFYNTIEPQIESPEPHKRTSITLTEQTLNCPSTATRPKLEQQDSDVTLPANNQMIIQQQQHPQAQQRSSNSLNQNNLPQAPAIVSSSGIDVGNFSKQASSVKQEDYFVLDNNNRVILVSSTLHPNTSALPSANYMAQANQRASCIQKPKSITRAGTENMARTQNQWQQPQPLRSNQQPSSYQQTNAQQKIVDQLSGKQGIKRKTSSSNVGTALKENSEQQYLMMEGGYNNNNNIHDQQQQQMYAGYSRHELHSQKANRNSNQNMKTAGLGVSRFGQMPPNFSTTTSTYQSIVTGSQPAPPQGLVYQLNQNGAYMVSQISGNGQAPTTQQSPTLAPNMIAQQRQHQQVLQNGQRVNASPQQQVYYSSQQQQIQANFQQQQNMQMQLQQQQQMAVPNGVQLSYQTSQQSPGANQQKQVQNSQSRTRPRSSAPTPSLTQVKKRVQSSINGGVVCRDSVPRAHPSVTNGLQVEIDSRQLTNENLMQTAGHIIVTTNQGGTPMNELYQPMIMNQNTMHNLQNPSLTPQVIQGIGGHKSLQATGVIGQDASVQQLTGGQNGTGRARSKRRDGSTSHSATQKGFFGKRKNRDRDSKLGVHQQPTAPVQKSSTQKASTLNQQPSGNQATISVPQGYLIRDSYQSSQHSGSANRPQTSKQQQQLSFHKTTASITNKINGSIINQQVNLTGESDSESTRGGQMVSESQIANSIVRGVFVNSRSSMQGSSRLVSDTSNAVHQSGFNNFQQRNLSSVRSGQLVNFTNSMSSDQEISNTNSKDQLALHKQLSNSDRAKILNQSASPSTKISIRGRKGINSIVGSGITPSGQTSTGLQMMPSTPKTYKRTKRLLFARRMNLMDRPVLIVTFQGVLGDFMKKSAIPGLKETPVSNQVSSQAAQPAKETKKPVQKEEEVFNLRQGVVEGLRYLSQLFQLIIFSRETVEDSWYQSKGGQCPAIEVQTKAILSWLQSTPEIKLDGFYASCLPAKQQTMTDDYSQIFIDFGLNSEQKVKEKVLFINSISNDFICNQRLPATGNISPKGKKPNPVQLGISNARGLTDIDSRGYFMFDLSCQPAEPLVKGLPISIDLKQQKTNRLEGARSSSITVDQQQEDKNSSCGGDRGEPELKTRHMPATLLVPNLRTQNVKMQTNFQHIIKTVMILAFMGQKQSAAKHLIKDNSVRDFATDLYELETDFGIIREKQIKLTQKRLYIMPQLGRGQTDLLPGGANSLQQNLNNSHKAASLQRRIRQANSNSNAGSVLHPQRETESPSSDVSGRNGNSGRYIQSRGVARQQTAKMQTNTSSHTTAATHIGHENTASSSHSNQAHQQLGKGRSQSINSEKGQIDQQMTQNESSINMGQMDHSPRDIDGTIMPYPGQRELSIDLTDGTFFANLSWSIAIDYLNTKPLNQQKRFLGMQSGCSDVIWRFYKKQATERVQLRKIYETKMKDAEHLIKHTLANETIVANQQQSMDQIFEILRSRDLVGNPFGFTMGRNYRFFANLKVQMRRKLSSELDQWKARNQAAASLKKPKEAAATQSSKEVAASKDIKGQQDATDMTVEDKELKEAARLNSIIQSQQVLQQQQYEAIEELLEKNQLMNRFVVVGLDAPFIK